MPKRTSDELPFPAPGLLRAARRKADFSQAELGKAAGIHPSMIGRIETGERLPSLAVFLKLLAATEHYLVVTDEKGRMLMPMLDREDLTDGAGRRYPSHLDTIVDPVSDDWWGGVYGLAYPPETFWRNRKRRDERRKVSQWEVRAAQHRGVPPPPGAYH